MRLILAFAATLLLTACCDCMRDYPSRETPKEVYTPTRVYTDY